MMRSEPLFLNYLDVTCDGSCSEKRSNNFHN